MNDEQFLDLDDDPMDDDDPRCICDGTGYLGDLHRRHVPRRWRMFSRRRRTPLPRSRKLRLTRVAQLGYTSRLRCADTDHQLRRNVDRPTMTSRLGPSSAAAESPADGQPNSSTCRVRGAGRNTTAALTFASRTPAPRMRRRRFSRSRGTRSGGIGRAWPDASRRAESRSARCFSPSNESIESSASGRRKKRTSARRVESRILSRGGEPRKPFPSSAVTSRSSSSTRTKEKSRCLKQ